VLRRAFLATGILNILPKADMPKTQSSSVQPRILFCPDSMEVSEYSLQKMTIIIFHKIRDKDCSFMVQDIAISLKLLNCLIHLSKGGYDNDF